MQVQMPVQLPVQVPVVARPINVPKTAATQYEMNKLFNEMKNSKKPFMSIKMKGPAKTSMFPDPFNLFDDNNRYFVSISAARQKAHAEQARTPIVHQHISAHTINITHSRCNRNRERDVKSKGISTLN